MRILVLGASGMLGNAMMRILSERSDWAVYGTIRSDSLKKFFPADIANNLLSGIDVEQVDSLLQAYAQVRPDVVINCIGLIKKFMDEEDPLHAISVNAALPHRLAKLCAVSGARLVHMSTDCVFSGEKGNYTEADVSDATDLYGKSKFLGEVNYPHALTLRTSIIGRELQSANGLIGWFLAQDGSCPGFRRAIFSGFPTVVLAEIVREFIIPNPDLHGLYHVAAQPISKYELLRLVADVYGKSIDIVADDALVIDRSLNADRFAEVTGYRAPDWVELIKRMHRYS
ncbi:NAD(P)-dependent oxidoreductase [Herminiimonas sp. KBW02]|uniref:dTDP-4-dehydrorhamnose reductase family protein n=1 Tax=Herminiimonas sp. KBW02 TaxID=2153363 RepID=UPI000F5B3A53|nr:SDR family oxidoreductase [Herminiimonas sp. KBW02]RQO36110.1 NAD(P)-dependent oxidoreductase [Herminiimonas sp. KBW02]